MIGSGAKRGRSAVVGLACGWGVVMLSAQALAGPPEVQETSVGVGLAVGQRAMALSVPGLDHRVGAWPGASLDLRQVLFQPESLPATLELRLQGSFFRGTSAGNSFDAPEGLVSQRYTAQGILGLTRPMGSMELTLGSGFGVDATIVTPNADYTGQQYLHVPVHIALRRPFGESIFASVELTALPVVAYNQSSAFPDNNAFGARAHLSAGWRPSPDGLFVELGYTYQRFLTYLPLSTGERATSIDVAQDLGVMVGWAR
ncbi:hypothetical protein EA187_16095 [Lujinxingia sediminis]|uniref:Outer membrane protein beta-barrel domain-containing protein n=1 Tax=Lujinxingia sediminis TaxID=2480984 RepID=A0ABY0CPK4_9DELT|nr:hypothetical protein [Lujinxingia sediminis]RVU42398.1 hypothetical protein EA187_16095 [Lujinxingia sediminis]